MALFADLEKRGGSLKEYSQKLEEKQAELSQRTVKLFAKKKENRADAKTLLAARADWQRRYNDFKFRSEAYERLKLTAPQATICKSSSLEDASQCLQWLLDGARR